MAKRRKYRSIVYIDGFNLYFGMRDAALKHCYWLDLHALSMRLMAPNNRLLQTKYFTARISGPEDPGDTSQWAQDLNAKRKRQSDYLDAIAVAGNIHVFEGQYRAGIVECHGCGRWWGDNEEKMTDVNIATEMLVDAYENTFDTAVLVSADSDLVPPLKAIATKFPDKRLIAAFPPRRRSSDVADATYTNFNILPEVLEACQLADTITLPSGHELKRPAEWAKQDEPPTHSPPA